MPSGFNNYVVVNSVVSNATGTQLGNVQYMPGLEFSGTQALKTFLLVLVNPALGLPYAVVSNQFGNLHSSEQLSQALNMFSTVAGDTSGTFRLVPVYQTVTDPNTGTTANTPVPGQFTVQDASGATLMSLRYSGQLDNRQLQVSMPDGTAKQINVTPENTIITNTNPATHIQTILTQDALGNQQTTTTLNGLATQSSYTTAGGSYTTITYNPDGSAAVVAYDASTGKTITTATDTQGNLVDFINVDHTMNQSFGNGTSGLVFDSWNNFVSDTLLNYNPAPQPPYLPGYNPADPYGFGPSLNPIGAFYESVAPALDLAPSIADKTPVLLDAANHGLTVSALTSRDTNADGQLTGTELNNLTLWADLNEDGHLDANELHALAQNGITQIQSADYAFYTRGNAVIGAGIAAAPARPDETIGVPAAIIAPAMPAQTVPAAPASNYRALRDTDNRYFWVSGGYISYIDWAPAQVKVNYNNRSHLIGTDGTDNFDSNYYNYAGTPINVSLLTNFLAGGGNDIFGGSINADNLWGGKRRSATSRASRKPRQTARRRPLHRFGPAISAARYIDNA